MTLSGNPDGEPSDTATATRTDNYIADSRAFAVTTDDRPQQDDDTRRQKVREALKEPNLPSQEKAMLMDFLCAHHNLFSLETGERGETGLFHMRLDTGDALLRGSRPDAFHMICGRRYR